MKNTKIEWCDHTFNPWIGCTRVSPGCVNCYAEQMMDRRLKLVKWGPGMARMRTSEKNWNEVRRWDADAASGRFVQCECGHREFRKFDNSLPPGGFACCSAPGCTHLPETECFKVRPRVFCASLADWLDPEVPVEWLADLLAIIHATPNLDWLLLTKRPELWRERMQAAFDFFPRLGLPHRTYVPLGRWIKHGDEWSWPNVWIGTSVEDQKRADERIPHLLNIPSTVRFLSCEPLLGPVIFNECLEGFAWKAGNAVPVPRVRWVIAGGESGPKARPMHPDWARSLRDQCRKAGVPFFFKQWGEWGVLEGSGAKAPTPIIFWRDDEWIQGFTTQQTAHMVKVGKKAAGRLLDGREWNEFPGHHEGTKKAKQGGGA